MFSETKYVRSTLEEGSFNKLSSEEAASLEKRFSVKEIWEAIKDCDGTKAHGFNFRFIKTFWNEIKKELIYAIMWFRA